ncbi:UNVERIFIED_CONTAM: OmpA family protein, partial [Salmonella enterica subsp. enterica serovar Weltevreden]
AGLGFVTGAISDFGFRVRLEGRYIYNDFLDGQQDYRVGLGLELPLMLPAEPMTPATIVEESVQVVDATAAGDADGDGVLDP